MSEKADRLKEVLREHGHRLTRARKAILAALVRSGGHVSADELAELAREDAPTIGRMTVYRTLDLLHQLGLIRPIYQGSGAAHYILMHEGHHHHLLCSNCDRVFEFDDCVLKGMDQAISDRFGFEIQGHLVELYGLCPRCRGQ